MLDTQQPDECCGDALSEALRSGQLDMVDSWTHEECGLNWLAVVNDERTVRHWSPVEVIEVFRI